ncbi:hypothetical protein LTS08_001317 [Lithohypha guttulata]|uniref:uncharacterized protein n=1 Tax=Lithohypha guttulata TaxID=1690604 RepID=UPI002DE08DC7|nr:hypothetical protein LTR51_004016 [Lithohypha guttulata]KAK5105044.1 hypothetical protein LTS08_001317 [Lithohypha guttulata]
MNMFKKGRKAKDQEDALDPFNGTEATSFAKASRALTRKKKKQDVEEQPVFDLASALPDKNDFRTSLLMPNLSARFSMLREQDDPNTKVGKASDDSVLFPKRASRLMLFNNNPLTDIAEVESIRSGIRPPFADERRGSLFDGYASDDGAVIMNRARPGEGNNLFGGRQKLYRIAASSTRDLSVPDITRGKHTYEHDTALSSFQQIRLGEKEQRVQQEGSDEKTDRNSYPTTESEEQESIRSPMTGFSKNRGTQSSTNSGPSNRRTSTAATSLVSDSPLPYQKSNIAINKVREQDVNSSAESIGFAYSPGLPMPARDDDRPAAQLSGSSGIPRMREHGSGQSPVHTSQPFRGISPPLNATSQPLDFGLQDVARSQGTSSRFQTTSPTPQFEFEHGDTLASSVRPNDRGKATAMGLFNKPARHYDEAQFQQRQMQMHEGRNSPISMSSRAASHASIEPGRSSRPSYASTTSDIQLDDHYTPQVPPIPNQTPSPVPSNRRSSANSTGRQSTSRPRTKSSTSNKEAAVKARVESLIRRQNAELAALEESQLGRNHSVDDGDGTSLYKNKGNGTFFNNSDHSDDEDSVRGRSQVNRRPSVPALKSPTEIHPALREDMQGFDFGTGDIQSFPSKNSNCLSTSNPVLPVENTRQPTHESPRSTEDVDSPTLPATGLGLSGLIRTHLRHDSDRSSMLPPPSPMMPAFDASRGSVSSTTQTVTESVKSDPFEYDSDRLTVRQSPSQLPSPTTATSIMSQKAQQILGAAMALRDAAVKADATPTSAPSTYAYSNDKNVDMQADALIHQRSDSTETQREMQRFDEELAARRKRIEEGLKSVQERSRSRSPHTERHGVTGVHGFSLPRFPGRSNTGDRFDGATSSKAIKMLGISSPPPQPQPSPRMLQSSARTKSDRSDDTITHHGRSSPHDHEGSHGMYASNMGRRTPLSALSNHSDRPPPPRSTTPSSRPGTRNRSNSAAADRSASRNKHIPDFDRTMMSNSPYLNGSPKYEQENRPDSSAGQYSDRTGYFNTKPLAAPEMNEGLIPRPSSRPSPNSQNTFETSHTPQMATMMSPPSSALPSPNPAAASSSSNGRTTPTAASGRATPSSSRKRSVTKGMISDPTFVSSTSTVPLVYLPRDGGPAVEPMMAPPLPAMNPRRRGTGSDLPPSSFKPHPAVRPNVSSLSVVAGSPVTPDFPNLDQPTSRPPPARPRNRLRKSSSEGGNMAARARQQALVAELAREKGRSPNVAVFPNRSATSLHTQEGRMF